MNRKRRRIFKPQSRSRLAGQRGYLMLAVMLLITVMLIALAVEAPRIAQQIKREKEAELIHRGEQYALAIKRFYHKVGTYPASLDQLDNSNNQRFLRQHYKDPMTASGEWKIIHYGEAQYNLPTAAGTAPGSTGTLNSSPLGGAVSPSASPSPSPSPGGLGATNGLQSGGQVGTGNSLGTLQTSNIGNGTQIGGQIMGVASTSKDKSIREFNGNNSYDQWLFVYDPRAEQIPGQNGIVIASPRAANSSGTGAPGATGSPSPQPGSPPPPGTPPVSGTPTPPANPR